MSEDLGVNVGNAVDAVRIQGAGEVEKDGQGVVGRRGIILRLEFS